MTKMKSFQDIEKQLTDAVVGAFGGQRLKAEINKTFANSPASLDAWQQLQHARQYLLTYNSDNLRRAKASIEAAIKTEPGYALAQAMYALLLTENVVNGLGETPDGDCETAANAADTALRIAPADPAVLRSVGCALAYLGNRQASLETLQRSVQLAPFDFGAWGYMGWPLSASSAASDAHKLLGICDRLLENAPEHPGVPYWHYHRSAALNALSQPEVALESVTACLQAQPEFALGHWQQANLYGRCGNSSAAAQAANKACRANARLDAENYKAVIYRLTNDEAAREQRLGGLKAAKLL